jgi:hypothetical protein
MPISLSQRDVVSFKVLTSHRSNYRRLLQAEETIRVSGGICSICRKVCIRRGTAFAVMPRPE